MPKIVNLATFWKPKACGQTVLPDRTGGKWTTNFWYWFQCSLCKWNDSIWFRISIAYFWWDTRCLNFGVTHLFSSEGQARSKNIPMSPNRLDNSIVYLRCAKKVIFWIFQIVWQTFICKNPSKKLSCLILLAWTFLFREFLNYICSTLVTLFL